MIKPDADRRFMEPSKDVSILKRSKSEPSLIKGVGGSETEALEKMAAEVDEGVLCRPVTWVDIFTSPEISAPRFPRNAGISCLVTSVGINTEWGLLMSSISEDIGEETPLQVRLNGVVTFIGFVGLAVALLVLGVLVDRFHSYEFSMNDLYCYHLAFCFHFYFGGRTWDVVGKVPLVVG